METLGRDWEWMVTFSRFPREPWKHLRITNVVESPFAGVRLRTDVGKRYKRVANATALIWEILADVAHPDALGAGMDAGCKPDVARQVLGRGLAPDVSEL